MHNYDKATALTILYRAYDTANQAWIQEDAATLHTLRLIRDGVYSLPVNTPQAVTHATITGLDAHSLAISASEADCDRLELEGESATEGVIIIPWVGQASRIDEGQLDTIETNTTNIASAVWSYATRTLSAFGFKATLTDSTEADIDDIKAKTALIGTGNSVAISPVSSGGKVTLYSGVDYTSDTTSIDIPDSSPSSLPAEGTALTLTAVTEKALTSTTFTLDGVVALDGTAKVARIKGLKSEIGDPALYRYFLSHEVNGTLVKLDIVGGLVVLSGI